MYSNGIAGNKKHSSPNNKNKPVENIYRYYTGRKDGMKIWIVDGSIIRRLVFNEFLYGGNPQRYPFVPKDEIWIDNSISAQEYEYTLAHELHEYGLMIGKGETYADAHNSAFLLELGMRKEDEKISKEHERALNALPVIDCDSVKEIPDGPDSVKLKDIYIQQIGKRGGAVIWIVDGSAVRREIYPDFGLSGNDMAYHFIPANEIWIDAQISCEETPYSIVSEDLERTLMAQGMSYDDAYSAALIKTGEMRNYQAMLIKKQKPVFLPKELTRDSGTGKADEK